PSDAATLHILYFFVIYILFSVISASATEDLSLHDALPILQQQLLRQRGLPRVGMADDGERPATLDFLVQPVVCSHERSCLTYPATERAAGSDPAAPCPSRAVRMRPVRCRS